MSRIKLEIKPHHSIEELEEEKKRAKSVVSFKQWLIIYLLAMGRSKEETAEIVGVTYDWVCKIVHRYNAEGERGMRDKREDKEPKKTILDEKQQKELFYALQNKAPDGGLWTGPKVTQWIMEKTGRKVCKDLGLLYLHRLGFKLRKPRPKNIKTATRDEKRAFKKNSRIS